MEKVLFESRKSCSPAGLSTLSRSRLKKMCLLITVLLLLIIMPNTPVSAAVEGLVAKSDDGSYHQYCYGELLDSYALKLLGRSNGLYEDFAAKKPVAFMNSVSGYIDYGDILDQYALALLHGQKFNLGLYLESSLAKKAKMPAVVKEVSLSEGRIVQVARNPGRDTAPAPVAVVTVSDPGTDLTGPVPAQPVSNPAAIPEKTADSEPQKPASATPIVSAARVTLDRAQQWAAGRGAHQRFIDIAPLYWEYSKKTGFCPEVLYAQSAYETNFGRFTGKVPPEYNNWAGIKIATSNGDKPEDHDQFATPEDGVRAHFNHIAAYTGLNPIGEPHGRYHVIMRMPWAGTVKTLEELSGKWAPSPTYHERIVNMLAEMR